jgi:long-chain fatty acid transport protein
LREQSAVGQGASFAGAAARSDDPSFLFFNPAAMAWLPGSQAALVGSGIFPKVEPRSGSAGRNALLGSSEIVGSLGGDIALNAFLPAFHASTALADNWRLGFSVTSPWGLVTKYPADSIGRYHALTSSLRTINLAPSIAWRPLPNLAFGTALQIQHADARLSNAVDFGAIGFLNPALRTAGSRPGLADGRATLTGDNTAVGWRIGAQWEPVPGTRLGAAFRSSVFHDLDGEARFEGVPAPLAATFTRTGGRAKLTTPEGLTLGVSQQVGDRWTLLAGAEWTNWSRFQDLVVRFNNGGVPSITQNRWRDTWFVSAGAEYRITDALTLRAGAAWDKSPTAEETRTPRIPDSDRYWLSAGASWQAMRDLTLSVAYTHIFADEGQVRLRDPGPGSSDFLRGNLSVGYSATVNILSFQANFAF